MDIISLSLVVWDDDSELKAEITKASDDGIVIFCSTSDMGSNWRPSFPAEYHKEQKVLAIAACDDWGTPLAHSQVASCDYYLPGKDIMVGPVPFVSSEERVTGSSVATAIAAGLGSLTLQCTRLAKEDQGKYWMELGRKWAVKNAFNRMCAEIAPKYVQPKQFVESLDSHEFDFDVSLQIFRT